MTNEQVKRIEKAISETQSMLARAQRYSAEFQDKKLIAFCEGHIAKLVGNLQDNRWVA